MGLLTSLFSKKREQSERFKQMEEDLRLQKLLEARQKNSNERELDRFVEEERQQKIKLALEHFRKQRQREAMETTVLGGKNLFKGQDNIAKGKASVLINNHKLFTMKEKKERGLFFK